MTSYQTRAEMSFAHTLAPFLTSPGLPFAEVLTDQDIQQAFAEDGVAFGTTWNGLFTPALMVWAFLSQVLSKDKSCRAALGRINAYLVAVGQNACSLVTGAFCRARAKIPAGVLRRLTLVLGRRLEGALPKGWLWHGRVVKLVDGTTLTAPDTEDNQRAYPQSSRQKPGLGFPILRMVVLLSLSTALVRGLALGPYSGKETGETALLRQLLDDLEASEVVVADRYYCNYWLVAMAWLRGVDVVFRLHQRRRYDFRRGQRLGPEDHVVVWSKPARPKWMDEATYASLPETLTVREMRYRITTPGCRTRSIVIVTTLVDPEVYSGEDLADLYHQRWHAELDLRNIKETLGMDQLRCKTPFMLEKEIWAFWLGYNLVRKISCQAALVAGGHPREVSFAATKQQFLESWGQLTRASALEQSRQGMSLLEVVGKEKVGKRPDRVEPRAVKRRPKPYDLLTKPRAQARVELLRGKAKGKGKKR